MSSLRDRGVGFGDLREGRNHVLGAKLFEGIYRFYADACIPIVEEVYHSFLRFSCYGWVERFSRPPRQVHDNSTSIAPIEYTHAFRHFFQTSPRDFLPHRSFRW